MISYHYDHNTIIQALFKTKTNKHGLESYNSIMHRLTAWNHRVNLQIIDNKVSNKYKTVIEDVWKGKYQLILP